MKMSFRLAYIFAYALALCLLPLTDGTSESRIRLKDNGYVNFVVGISPDVQEERADEILENLKTLIREASLALYRATRQRLYFKTVHILLPQSWKNVSTNESSWETYDAADIRIAPQSWKYQDMPFTVHSGGCGEFGEYIHLTPNYLITLKDVGMVKKYGPPAKNIAQQWAKFRYGVFEENGEAGNKLHPLFFRSYKLEDIVPNLCTSGKPIFTTKDVSTGGSCTVDRLTGIYDQNCKFELDRNFRPNASLMTHHPEALNSIFEFCDNDQHDVHAPTKHNLMCGLKSVWYILKQHSDFLITNTTSPYTEPEFQVVRPYDGTRYVLVMDVSLSMDEFERVKKMYNSAKRWIQNDLSNGSYLGLVQFSQKAQILSSLVPVEMNRNYLVSKLPTKTYPYTCIGCGLQEALKILNEAQPKRKGGVIVLITDGEENTAPYINDVLQSIIDSGVRIVSIAFGSEADPKIETLATKTGGKSYFVADSGTNQQVNDALIGSLTYQPAISSDTLFVKLLGKEYQVAGAGTTISDSFIVDTTVGKNFKFYIFAKKTDISWFNLISPNGATYTLSDLKPINDYSILELPQNVLAGNWTFKLASVANVASIWSIEVVAQVRQGVTAPIVTKCFFSETSVSSAFNGVKLLAAVTQGSNPVIRIAKVMAYVETPTGVVKMELKDDGTSGDTYRDDGIYSNYFAAFSDKGRYIAKCQVEDNGSAYVNDGFIAQRYEYLSANTLSSINATQPGPFARSATAGSFMVTQEILDKSRKIPPGRVTDLSLLSLRHDNSSDWQFKVQFTATGDKQYSGKVRKYKMLISSSWDDLLESYKNNNIGNPLNTTLISVDMIVNGTLEPQISGSVQAAEIYFNGTESPSLYLAVYGESTSGLKSELSNIVQINSSLSIKFLGKSFEILIAALALYVTSLYMTS